MPGLSDPGFTLVRACIAEDIPVTVLPGPSAISTALVVSGLPVDRFAFVGFLERSRNKLVEQLVRFEGSGATLVAFESPRRIRASLEVIGERWPEREVAVCRELTKLHEEVLRGTAMQVHGRLADVVRGEIVLVVAPSSSEGGSAEGLSASANGPVGKLGLEQRARAALSELAGLGVGTKKAAALVAGLTGLSQRRAYELGLEVRADSGGQD